MPITQGEVEAIVAKYQENKKLFELFLNSVESDFLSEVSLNTGVPTVIHSMRKRLKDEGHLAAKIRRKVDGEGRIITPENVFSEITDLAGVRVLHLHQAQFSSVHDFVLRKIKKKAWKLLEKPIAYTWDPESVDYFKRFKLKTSLKSSYYTSVHYLLAPANDASPVCCEVQVRTLFEEAWGEIDHSINYPEKTDKLANLEQLRVLSKLVSTGSRLADSIFKIHQN